MALSVRSAPVKGAVRAQPRVAARTVRPVAALTQQQTKVATAGLAGLAVAAAFAAAPAEAHNLVSTVASAAEGYPFVPPAWAPSVLVPVTGLVLPGIVMAWAFNYIEQEKA